MQPTVGRIVHYQISAADAGEINRRRHDAHAFRRSLTGPVEAGERGRTGHVEHAGNGVTEGDVYPAMVVRVFDPSTTTANLQVLLDGNDHYWATSRQEGEEPGNWSWPAKVTETAHMSHSVSHEATGVHNIVHTEHDPALD